MSKSLQLKVSNPCHENWHSMTPKEQGRFCGSCEKLVVDFSKMSDKEMLHYFTKADGQSTCGRFANDQLNRKLEEETNRKRFSLAYAWNMLLASVLFFQSCRTRTTGIVSVKERPSIEAIKDQKKDSVAVDKDSTHPKPPAEIKGKILNDESGLPVAGARVNIAGSKQKAVTDSKGRFSLLSDNNNSVTLEVSAQNFYTKTVQLNSKNDWTHVKVMLTEEAFIMGEIAAEDVSGKNENCIKEKQ